MHAGSFGNSSLSISTRTTLQATDVSATPCARRPYRTQAPHAPSSRVKQRAAAPPRAAARVRLRPSSRCGWPRPGRSAHARPHRPSPADAAVTVAMQRRRVRIGPPRPARPLTHSLACVRACMHACTQALLMTHTSTTLGHDICTSALARTNKMRFARVGVRVRDSGGHSAVTNHATYTCPQCAQRHSDLAHLVVIVGCGDGRVDEEPHSEQRCRQP